MSKGVAAHLSVLQRAEAAHALALADDQVQVLDARGRRSDPMAAVSAESSVAPSVPAKDACLAARYDGSFDGLLSVVFFAYAHKQRPCFLLAPHESAPLMCTVHDVPTVAEHSARVMRYLSRVLSAGHIRRLLLAWMSEEPGSALLLFRYICKVTDSSGRVASNMADPDILDLMKMARRVSVECHALYGFVRFQKTSDDIYVAIIGPRYNVLEMLIPYFSQRFATQSWVLYDAERKKGVYHDAATQEVQPMFMPEHLVQGAVLSTSLLAEGELQLQQGWRQYFKSISIGERKNSTQQRRCMPQRYWPYLIEKS